MTSSAPAVILDGLLEAVWQVEARSLRLIAVNEAACRLMGAATPAELLGRCVTDFAVSAEDMVYWSTASLAQADTLWSQTTLARLDGRQIPVERRVTPVRLAHGEGAYLVALLDRSREQQVETELEQLVGELRATLDSTADGVLVCDLRGQVRGLNRRFAQIWSLPEALLTTRNDAALHAHMAEDVLDRRRYEQRLEELAGLPELEASDTLMLRDGRTLERASVPQFSRGRPIGRVYSFRDITEQVAAEANLRVAAKVFASSLDAIFIAGPNERILAVNPPCLQLAQAPEARMLGTRAGDWFTDPTDEHSMDRIRAHWRRHGFWEGELWHRRADGTLCLVHLSWVVLRDAENEVQQSIGFFRDLTEQRAARKRIEQLAYSDVLTGLPNRLLLSQRVEFAVQMARRQAATFAILFLDLDRFKNINDSLGHPFGDRVLVQVAARIRACLRDVDILCRLGGDEFVVYLHGVDAAGAERVAGRILQEMAQPFVLDDMSFTIGCSIGAAMYPQDGQSLDELIKQADTAMYDVKAQGRGALRFYQPQMNVDLLDRMKLESAMREALARRQFRLHYQPQLAIEAGAPRLVGAEALLRWVHEERGPVSPGQFIPIAEESGFIVSLGAWVIEEAVQQAVRWQQAGTPVMVSVNVSALQFRQPGFVDHVARTLSDQGLAAGLLELELTESILVQDAAEVLQRLQILSALGVQLAIDDFGTGYSNLAYLKKFPLHKLKIDQSFVRGLLDSDSDRAIVVAMISLGQALNLKVIAEGVETEAQRALLHTLGCDEYQGFLYSPGVPAADFERFLARG